MISFVGGVVISVTGSPSPTFSPVNGFFVVGVVVVFSPSLPGCFTRSVPGGKSGLNSLVVSYGIGSFVTIGSPGTGPCFVTLSTGGVTISPVFGFLIPGFPGTSSVSPTGKFGSNSSLCPGGTSSPPYSMISFVGGVVISVTGSPSPTFSPVNGFFVVGVVVVFSPSLPGCFTRSVPGGKSGLNSLDVSYGIGSFVTIGSPGTGPRLVTLSTGGVTISPVSGFLTPGLPGTSLDVPTGKFGSNSSWCPGGTSTPPYSMISSVAGVVICVTGTPLSTTSPVLELTFTGVVIVFSPSLPGCFTRSVPGAKTGLNRLTVLYGIFSLATSGVPSTIAPCGSVIVIPSRFVLIIPLAFLSLM